MQMQEVQQPMQIQPLSQPQAGQPQTDAHRMFQDLLVQLQQAMKPTDQSDPLAPVGVTPAQGKAADVKPDAKASSGGKKSEKGGLLSSLEGLLGGDAKSADKTTPKDGEDKEGSGLADLLTGKKSFSDTKMGKAVSAVEGIGKLLALL